MTLDDSTRPPREDVFLRGGGEMGALMRAKDWAPTLIGPVDGWSPSLRMVVGVLLANRFPMLLWWGPDYVSIYNDAYRPVLGEKHPAALGAPFREVWPEVSHILGPLIDAPFRGGPSSWTDDILLEVNRHGFVEETHFTFAYSPVPDETAPRGIGGVLATVHEITEKVVGERRLAVLRDLGAQTGEARTAEQACADMAAALARHGRDIPFALLYLIDEDGAAARLAGSVGLEAGAPAAPQRLDLSDAGAPWPLAEVKASEAARVVERLGERFSALPAGPWADPPHAAVVLPVRSAVAHQPAGFLIAGASPRLKLDDQYLGFFDLAAAQISAAITHARAYEAERRRAEALAALDRAKTAFFSNVSHEFRTPLTLMLGPLEDALCDLEHPLAPGQRARVDLAQRNGLRLQRLVNALLDFSRVEAGRIRAVYQPTELATFTSDLASSFRAACDSAGLKLTIDAPPLAEPVFVDREMWEKVVLNLVSNAFKFTFEGGVDVSLKAEGGEAVLRVRDTGAGIPEAALPHIFERFHRVEGAQSRSHEGTGIGLALVQELVNLHKGSISVDSRPGEGATFTVRVPLGAGHLPQEQIRAADSRAASGTNAAAFVGEALRWLPDGVPVRPEPLAGERPRLLVADDNADMRDYLRQLLGLRYEVEAVASGVEALAAMRARRPDLLLSDIMMPGLDGHGLLGEVRADPALGDIPVVLLSARAGEEATIEGLDAGADDYLVKPFSARELLARVAANLERARGRRQIRESEARFRALTNATSDVVYRMSPDWTELRALDGRGFLADTRGPKAAWIDEYLPPHDQPRILGAIRRAIESKAPFQLEHRVRRADGGVGWTFSRAIPILGEDGEIVEWFGAATDVTERRGAEQRRKLLVALTERLAELDDPAEIAGAAAESLGRVLEVSRVRYGSIIPGSDRLSVDRDWSAAGSEALASVLDLRAWGDFVDRLKRGELVEIPDVRADVETADAPHVLEALGARALVAAPVVERGELVAVLLVGDRLARRWTAADTALIKDVAAWARMAVERARTTAALKEANETLERRVAEALAERRQMADVLEAADIFVQALDRDFRIIAINKASADEYQRTYGLRPKVGDQLLDLLADRPALRAPVQEVWTRALAGESFTATEAFGDPAFARRFYEMTFRPLYDAAGALVGAYQFAVDVTERREAQARLVDAEERLRQSQKMEAVGQLTGGLAHDFNNLLSGIIGGLELIDRRLAEGRFDGLARYIDAAQGASRRAAALTQRLLAFSRRQTLDPKPLDTNRLVGGMEELIRRSIGPDVALEVVAAEGLWITRVDASQLESALLNLCLNGRDAMAPGGGRLTIEIANRQLDEGAARERELPPGQFVVLSVTDTGTGMTPDVIAHAFDPFFTTKPLGEGTGLGLSMVHGFVRQSGGEVGIESAPGAGATVSLYLPRHLGEALEADVATPAAVESGQGQTVLVVDDEETIRMLIADILEESGYRVVEAGDGPAALRILQSDARIDFLVTDVGLPGGLNGRQVADAARLTRRDLKVLFITGFAETAALGSGGLEPGMQVLTKPFVMADFVAKVRVLIDG